jgi:hypothetical protein
MSRGRSAIVMLVGALLLVPSAHGARSRQSFSLTGAAITADQPGSNVIGRLASSRSTPSEALARFTVWKPRPKILMPESDRQVVEETDVGPAPAPSGLSTATSLVFTLSHLSSPPPLRC